MERVLSNENKKKVKRAGAKYICPYCKSYYYFKNEAEECRDRCYELLKEGKVLPNPEENKPDLSSVLEKINRKK